MNLEEYQLPSTSHSFNDCFNGNIQSLCVHKRLHYCCAHAQLISRQVGSIRLGLWSFTFHVSTNRRCTYNVTLRRVRVTTAVVEKQQVLNTIRVCP